MPNEVEILGQKAKIAKITGQLANWPRLSQSGGLLVSILFDEPIDGFVLMQVLLPVKQYELNEFLDVVKEFAEKNIITARRNNAEHLAFIDKQNQRTMELETMAGQLRDLLGLP